MAVLMTASAMAYADPLGKAVSMCNSCHKQYGNTNGSSDFPKLAGQNAAYLAAQLHAFKQKVRLNPTNKNNMNSVARSLDDALIEEIAEYYNNRPSTSNYAADPSLVQAGREVYQNGIPSKGVLACAVCHGADGKGAGVFPVLATQNAKYIARQLKSFKEGELRKDATTMPALMAAWDLEEADAVAAYIQSMGNE